MSAEDEPDKYTDFGITSLVKHWKRLRAQQTHVSLEASAQVVPSIEVTQGESGGKSAAPDDPEILMQAAVVELGEKTDQGHLIQAVTVPWFEIVRQLQRDPEFLYSVDWRKFEEIIAGAYKADKWDVELTPPTGDGGRDIIATKPGLISIRIIDQAKKFSPRHKVQPNDVRAIVGVLSGPDQNISKCIVTTTSDFGPSIFKEYKHLIPHRLQLRNGQELIEWLQAAGKTSH